MENEKLKMGQILSQGRHLITFLFSSQRMVGASEETLLASRHPIMFSILIISIIIIIMFSIAVIDIIMLSIIILYS